MSNLVINADDLGLAPGVNRGILEAHAAGTVTSASILVTGAAFDDAVALLRGAAGELSVGLHLDLVCGRPLACVPSLTDPATGGFYPLGRFVWRVLRGLVRAEDVARECDAQLHRLRAAGVRTTHVDSHRHTHALPAVLPAVIDSAHRAGVPVMRRPIDRLRLGTAGASAKGVALRAAWRLATRGLGLPPAADYFRALYLPGPADFGDRLLALLDVLPAGTTELVVHPGIVDATLVAIDPYTTEREHELQALMGEPLRARLRRGDIRLITMSDLAP